MARLSLSDNVNCCVNLGRMEKQGRVEWMHVTDSWASAEAQTKRLTKRQWSVLMYVRMCVYCVDIWKQCLLPLSP